MQKEREKSRWGRTSTSSAPRSVPEEGAAQRPAPLGGVGGGLRCGGWARGKAGPAAGQVGQEGHASDHLARSTSWNPPSPLRPAAVLLGGQCMAAVRHLRGGVGLW